MKYLDHSPKKVWLVGMGPSWTDIIPPLMTQEATPDLYDEVWAVNMAANVIWHDVVFWMDDLDSQDAFKPGLISMLRRRNKPVITSKAYDWLPCSYDYPLSECAAPMMEKMGIPYMNNSIAQAIAYAMHKKVEHMTIYGADFTYPNRDYAESGRACVEAWITLAHLSGLQIGIAGRSSLFDACQSKGVYGYHTPPEIRMPNGDIMVAPAMEGCSSPPLNPNEVYDEQLSGVRKQPAEQQALPGEVGGGAEPAADNLHDSESVEPAAAPRPGEGLRHRGDAGRDQTGDPAGAGNGRAEGRV